MAKIENGGWTDWVGKQLYVPRNLIAIVTRNFSKDEPHGAEWAEIAKYVIELQAISIKGFDTAFDVDSTRMKTLVDFVFQERYGRPMDAFFTQWFREKVKPFYRALHESELSRGDRIFSSDSSQLTQELAEMKREMSIDVMFIEPDPTHTRVVTAWSCKNFHPVRYNGIASERSLSRQYPMVKDNTHPLFKGFKLRGSNHIPKGAYTELRVQFDCEAETGNDVQDAAQTLLNELALQETNPYERNEFINTLSDLVERQSKIIIGMTR